MRAPRRYSRQTKLAAVGQGGQARISAATASAGDGLSGWVAARYLAGAGVGELRVGSEAIARAAREMDDAVRVEIVDEPLAGDERFSDLDPAARDVAVGAHRAVVALMRAIQS
jgi:hypothetical protein